MFQCIVCSSLFHAARVFYEYFVCSYDLFLALFWSCQGKVKDACLSVCFFRSRVQGYFLKARWVWKILSDLSTIFFLETAFVSVMCSWLRSLLEVSHLQALLSSWIHKLSLFILGELERHVLFILLKVTKHRGLSHPPVNRTGRKARC